MTTINAPRFKLSFCGRFVIDGADEAHPVILPLVEAAERQKRAEAEAARYEREGDEFHALGRLWDAGYARDYCRVHLTIAADLLVVLQGADERRAA
jgi:hypothetical protein